METEATYTLKKAFATFVHDCIAHPLTWLTRDSDFSWRLHDWAGGIMLDGQPIDRIMLTVHNPSQGVGAAHTLRAAGYVVGCGGRGEASTWTQDDDRERTAALRARGDKATGELVVGDVVLYEGDALTVTDVTDGQVSFEGRAGWIIKSGLWEMKP